MNTMKKALAKVATVSGIALFMLSGCSLSPEPTQEENEIKSVAFYEKSNEALTELFRDNGVNTDDRSLVYSLSCADLESEDPYAFGQCVLNINFNEPRMLDSMGEIYSLSPELFDFLEKWTYIGTDGLKPEICKKQGYCGTINEVVLDYRGDQYTFSLDEWETVANEIKAR